MPKLYSNLIGITLSTALGLIYFLYIFPSGFVSGNAGYFKAQAEDVTQYLSGYLAYINEPWSFPLLWIGSINYPQGTLVTFVDAVPILSFIMKLLGPLAPENPFGLWVLLCFLLQGVAAWWAASQAKPQWIIPLVVAGIAVQMPALSMRLGHLSLMAHFLIIFAIGLYIRERVNRKSALLLWALLLFCAFYINIYLTALCVVVMVASAIDHASWRRSWSCLASYLLALAPLIVSIPITMGVKTGEFSIDPAFGFYSMNLLAPLQGGYVIQLPFFSPGTEGQYEGYNYLGLGVILTAVLSFTKFGKSIAGWALIVMMLGCFLYSLSNEVYVSAFHLLSWRVPDIFRPLFETFRVSGRFFWVVGYVIVILAILKVSHLPRIVLLPGLIFLLLLQTYDLRSHRAILEANASRAPSTILNENRWLNWLSGVDTIYLYPKFRCGAGMEDVLPIQLIAAKANVNITTGYVSRSPAICDTQAAEIANSDINKSAYAFALSTYNLQEAQQAVPSGITCNTIERWHFCRASGER